MSAYKRGPLTCLRHCTRTTFYPDHLLPENSGLLAENSGLLAENSGLLPKMWLFAGNVVFYPEIVVICRKCSVFTGNSGYLPEK